MMVYVAWWLIYAIRARVEFEVEMGLGIGSLWAAISAPRILEGSSMLVDWSPALSLLGWALLCLSMGLFGVAMLSLRQGGNPTSGWENTTELTQSGMHGLVRHPMQLSGIVGACGVALAQPTLLVIILATASVACFALGVRAEDRFNIAKFGEPYRIYMGQVPALNLFAGIWAWLKARDER